MDLETIEKCLNIIILSMGIIGALYGFWKWLEPRISQSNGSSSYTTPSLPTKKKSDSSAEIGLWIGLWIGTMIGAMIGMMIGLAIGGEIGARQGAMIGAVIGAVIGAATGAAIGEES